MDKISACTKQINGFEVIELFFNYNAEIIGIVKSIKGRQYHSTTKSWTIPDSIENRKTLTTLFSNFEFQWINMVQPQIKRYHEYNLMQKEAIFQLERTLELRGYSKNTLNTYRHMFKLFLAFFPESDPVKLSEGEIVYYLHYLVKKRNVSRTYQNQSINAIKFYYEKVLGANRKEYYLERPRKESKLPTVLSESEVKEIMQQIKNFKHRIAMMLIYSGGLRRSELLGLKVRDIDFERNQIWIRGGKGLKDRFTLLAEKLKTDLRTYIELYQPREFIIEGKNGGEYSAGSLRNILKEAVLKTSIRKNVTLHTLRHSFATHLLEHGTSTRFIQDLLGHNSPKTTEIYTHITKKGMDQIKSPLDEWE